MSFKAKTVLNKDIRIFKQDINTMQDALEAIKEFIREKYAIQGGFTIQYEDEEKDIITIASSEDLEEAYNQAESNGSVLKLLVVPENSNAPVYEFTSEIDKSEINKPQHQQEKGNNVSSSDEDEEEEEEESSEEEKKECFGKQLLKDLIENEEFRKEFINFITTFIKILQQDIEKFSNEAFIQALSKHDNISQYPSMKKLLDLFPLLFQQFQPLLFLISNIDADNIGVWINNIINMLSNFDMNQAYSIPMMLMSWFGGMPFGHPHPHPHPHGPHGDGHRHGHGYPHYGHHMPPPPPPPFWFGGNPFFGAFNQGTPFGHGMPPPPPPPSPFAFFGFPRHGPHGPHGHHFGRRHGGCPMFRGCHGKRMCNEEEEEHNENNNNNNNEYKENKCGWKKYHKWCKKNEKLKSKENKKEKKNKNKEYYVEIINDEITLIDKAYVLPGQVIIKTWHIKNNGVKDWPEGIKLKYFGKTFNPIINGVEFNVPNLKIGEESDISVTLEIPNDEQFIGKQKANFRLLLPNNDIFGPIFRVRVIVVNNNNNNNNNNEIESEKNNNNNKLEIDEEKKENNINESDVIKQLKEVKEQQQEKISPSLLEEENKKPNKIESSPSSFTDIHIPKIEEINFDEDVIEPPKDNMHIENNVPIMESNLNNSSNNNNNNEEFEIYEQEYIYQKELNMILSMGFNDVEKVRNLLNNNRGDVNVVINQLFA